MERRDSYGELRPYDAERVLQIRQEVDQLFQQSDIEVVRLLTLFLMQMREAESGREEIS